MRIAILSDIHSNSEALGAVLDYCKFNRIHKYVCLGDIVGYGADPNACCEMIRSVSSVTLLGNHDAAVSGMMDTEYYYPAARHALFWTRQALTPENFQWLYGLPYTYTMDNLGFFHSAPIMPSGFFYVVRNEDAQAHLKVFEKLQEFNFVGHSHLTNQYILGPRRVKDATGKPVGFQHDKKWIINVGSVGQPRDRDNRACFGLFDTDSQTFEHIRIDYDIDATAGKILRAGLDEKFAKRLFVGL
ncbi:MAG: putative phosphodiesterase [Myxococcota bacterium]|jgi:predicted phosphodiesterase